MGLEDRHRRSVAGLVDLDFILAADVAPLVGAEHLDRLTAFVELYAIDGPGGEAGPNWLSLRVSFHSQFDHAVRRVALEVDTVAGKIHRAALVGGDLEFLARVVGAQLALDRVSARGEEGFVLTRPRREGTAHPLLGGKPCIHAR